LHKALVSGSFYLVVSKL